MRDIVIRGLGKAYDGKPVLDGLTLTFPSGQISAVMAPSGAGKTTLLRLLMGLEKPDRGSISGLEGLRISAVFQENRLLEYLTPAGNLRLTAPELTQAEILGAMREMQLTGCEGQPVRELSGGMKRRVALLRALLTPCDLLLLDEPFKGLDDRTLAAVIAFTRAKCAGRTTVLVTHSLAEATAMGAMIFTPELIRSDAGKRKEAAR